MKKKTKNKDFEDLKKFLLRELIEEREFSMGRSLLHLFIFIMSVGLTVLIASFSSFLLPTFWQYSDLINKLTIWGALAFVLGLLLFVITYFSLRNQYIIRRK